MTFSEKILQHPAFYSLSQFLLAPGAQIILNSKIAQLVHSLPHKRILLDIGCGPKSWLWKAGLDPIGLDISFRYSKTYGQHGIGAITGSSAEIPIKENSIDGIWCIGMLHHLNDTQVKNTVQEMLRIVSNTGYIIILDAVLPRNKWRRSVASLIRRMDRGRFMRTQLHLELLLSTQSKNWNTRRYTYAATGLEMLECTYTTQNTTSSK